MHLHRGATAGALALSGNLYLESNVSPTLNGAGFGIYSGNIIQGDSSTASSLTKSGVGTWQLSGQNTYAGTTTV